MANEAKDIVQKVCTLYEKGKNKGESVVNDPQISLIDAMIIKATILKNDGLSEYVPFIEKQNFQRRKS